MDLGQFNEPQNKNTTEDDDDDEDLLTREEPQDDDDNYKILPLNRVPTGYPTKENSGLSPEHVDYTAD